MSIDVVKNQKQNKIRISQNFAEINCVIFLKQKRNNKNQQQKEKNTFIELSAMICHCPIHPF